MNKVVVIGSLNMDIVAKVDHIARPGETIIVNNTETKFGGKGANQAFYASMAGAEVSMIGKVGNDEYGKAIIENMKNLGIDSNGISIDEKFTTGNAIITVDKNAENAIVVINGANSNLLPEDIINAEDIIKECDVVLISQEIQKQTIEEAIMVARKYNKYTILNPAPTNRIDEKVLSFVNLVTPNRTEIFGLLDENPNNLSIDNIKTAAKKLLDKNVMEVIVTVGADGVLYSAGNNMKRFPANSVIPCDTTGAGDCFNGYLATCIARDIKIDDAIITAGKAAAKSITKLGAQVVVPSIEQL